MTAVSFFFPNNYQFEKYQSLMSMDNWYLNMNTTFLNSWLDKNAVHRPGIEPGPPAWQASILPLNQRC